MGLSDFFKRRSNPPTDLREALFQAVDRQDWPALAALCKQHNQEIRASFPLWQQVPELIRKDRVAQNRYCQGLIAVAQVFDQAGDGSLRARLLGDKTDNPIQIWERDLATAQSLIDNGRPDDAVKLLQSVLTRTAELTGSGVDHYLPRTYGMLGVAYFRAGNKTKAVEITQKAKTLCQDSGDAEGVAVYARNLQHLQDGATVVFRGSDGRNITLEELRDATGTFRYEIFGSTNLPPEAAALHKKARQAGAAGKYKEALVDLARAAALALQWPYPLYDMAFTYLLMKDFENAREYFRKTVELAPRGFFTAITALDTLTREEKGDLPVGTYLAYMSLEWIQDPGEKVKKVRELVARVPIFAPAWKELAVLLDGPALKLDAIEHGLRANPDSETKGILQINKALILSRTDYEAAVRLLGELILDPTSTYATEHMGKVALASIAKR